jgi:cytoplasmic iron level regulating protein YaaA (DUF328/UPF0246 family)
VRLLLPPSEVKTPGGRGRSLRAQPNWSSDDPLRTARRATLAALDRLVQTAPDEQAVRALALPPGLAAAALATNRAVLDAPTSPALRRYAGVVYDGLEVASLPPAARRLADRSILVFSGLFGVVAGNEPIPDYRVPGKAVLPELGVAATFWRPILSEVLPTLLRRHLVVDLRSSDYAAMWRPASGLATRVVRVRVLSPLPSGRLGVVSYNSKLAKGRLARALLLREAAGEPVRTPADLCAAWAQVGGGPAEFDESEQQLVIHERDGRASA